jgi:hypothetical protein
MKFLKILALLILMVNFAARASVQIPETATRLSNVENGVISNVELKSSLCGPFTLCQPKIIVTLRLSLKGCLDKLGPVGHSVVFNEQSGRYVLVVNAINIHMKGSDEIVCFAPTYAEKKIALDSSVDREELELQLLK